MLIVEPVVTRSWLAEWTAEKTEIAAELERAEAAKSPAARTKRRNEAERRYRAFLNRLRAFTVLDPACGSGNFLYLALQALKDLEHRVQFEAESLGFQRAFPEIGPANVKGIEINPYAAELARVSVWIGEIQWMRRNGFFGGAQPDPEAARHHRVPGRDPDAGRRGTGLAEGRRRDREPAVPGREAPDHAPRRGLRVADVQDLCGARSGGSRSGLLLVREGRPADRGGQDAAGRARRHELDPRRREPAGAGGGDPQLPAACGWKPIGRADGSRRRGDRSPGPTATALRGVERRTVGDRRGRGQGVAGLLLASRRRGGVWRSARRPARRRDLHRPDGAARRCRRRPDGCPATSAERGRGVHGRHEGRSLRRGGRSGSRVAATAGEPERPHERRRSEAVGERHGPHPAAGREVDRRLRLDDVSRRRGAVRRTVPVGEGTRPSDAPEESARSLSRVLVAARRAAPGHVAGAQRPAALHRDADRRQTPAIRLVRRTHLSGPGPATHRARRSKRSRSRPA